MQELSVSIQQRIKKTKQVVQNNINYDLIRSFREQQKIRCEKQNFILAMMKSNKVLTPNLKKSYLRISEDLMALLEPSFLKSKQQNSEEDFLNDFVHLYTSFFAYFEDKFTFKTKIKNYLRPTNHNLVIDLIKYFVDFTRDYYAQTLFWKMRNTIKNQNVISPEEDNLLINGEEGNFTKLKPFNSFCRNYSYFNQPYDASVSPRKKTAEQAQQKRNNQKNYDILEVNIPLITMISPKEHSANIESLKIKVNQLFRDQKSRNSSIKRIYEDYLTFYKQKYNKPQNNAFLGPYISSYKKSDHFNQKCYPLKLLLSIQKTGFSVILVQVDSKKTKNTYLTPGNKFFNGSNSLSLSNSPVKLSTENSLSPLKITQRVNQAQDNPKIDYFLTSMKVLRVSQNFLPPLINSNTMLINTQPSSRKQTRQKSLRVSTQKQKNLNTLMPFSLKLRKMTNQNEQHLPLMGESTNLNNVLLRSTSFKSASPQKDKKKLLQKYNNELYAGDYICQKQSSSITNMKRKDSQDLTYRVSNKKIDIKRKLIEERKSFQHGMNSQSKYHTKQSTHTYESQEKILQWLQKIKNLKEIQRRKILGMNY